MKKRCTEEQIVYALMQAELNETVADICRINPAVFFEGLAN